MQGLTDSILYELVEPFNRAPHSEAKWLCCASLLDETPIHALSMRCRLIRSSLRIAFCRQICSNKFGLVMTRINSLDYLPTRSNTVEHGACKLG